jgi:acetyl esterase/lipase
MPNSRTNFSCARRAVGATAIAACLATVAACSSSSRPAATVTSTSSPAGATSTSSSSTTTLPLVRHSYAHVTVKTTFANIVGNPAFAGFGPYVLPTEVPSEVKAMGPATPEILHVAAAQLKFWDPQTMIDGLNFLIDEVNAGVPIWHPLYSAQEIAADPTKKSAGLWFIPGDANKPLAFIAAGGGFRAVASIQEAFPHAQKLHELGYNVAILKYRVSSVQGDGTSGQKNAAVQRAIDDMAAAMAMLKTNADAWHISFANYCVWGSSAGGEIMNAWTSDSPLGAKAHGFDLPAVVVAAYTPPDQTVATASLPPYFIVQGAADTTVSVPAVDKFVGQLKAAGVTVQYTKYPAVGHGFGLGTGTSAAGWIDHAIAFWQAHTKA